MTEVKINKQSFEQLKERAEQTGCPVQEIVNEALEQFLANNQ
jgi:predicted DNA binding CopG/RHH family protein